MDVSNNTVENSVDERIIKYYREETNDTVRASDLLELYHMKKMKERLKLISIE